MRPSRIGGVAVIAIVGLVLAAAITYAASTLVSQPIGLTSEPQTLGEGLAPAPRTETTRTTTATPPRTTTTTTVPRTTTTTTTTTVAPPATATTPGSDDHGGEPDSDDD